jgi:hypothetical protein
VPVPKDQLSTFHKSRREIHIIDKVAALRRVMKGNILDTHVQNPVGQEAERLQKKYENA